MSQQICFHLLQTLPMVQQKRIVKRLQESANSFSTEASHKAVEELSLASPMIQGVNDFISEKDK